MNWDKFVSDFIHISIAFLLALPIGWDQERESKSAGLRTFPLISAASCGYMLIAIRVLSDSSDAQSVVIEGLIAGIGFICGGAIFKEGATVRGTVTAASLFNTGAIGAAVAYRRYEVALVLSLINFFTLFLRLFKRRPPEPPVVSTDDDDDDDD